MMFGMKSAMTQTKFLFLKRARIHRMKSYRPSNGSEGMAFQAEFCDRCVKDGFRITEQPEDGCAILKNALLLDIEEEGYPKEWIENDDGTNPRCTAFKEGTDNAMIEKMERKDLDKAEAAWMKAAGKESV